jgi:RNA polymerase sigma-70 factor (ECF subfamily)
MPLFRETEEFSIFHNVRWLSYDRKYYFWSGGNWYKEANQALPIDQQEVLVMRMYQDMSFKEISEITGVIIHP